MATVSKIDQVQIKDEHLALAADPAPEAISTLKQFNHEFEFVLSNGFPAQQTFAVPFPRPPGSGFFTMLQSLDYRFSASVGAGEVARPLGHFSARVAYLQATNSLVCNVSLGDSSPANEPVLIRVRGGIVFF